MDQCLFEGTFLSLERLYSPYKNSVKVGSEGALSKNSDYQGVSVGGAQIKLKVAD